MKWKHRKLSRHFSLTWWLCQVLAVLRSIPLQIKKLLKHPRLLFTLLFTLKINLIHRIHIVHLNHMIPSLMHWRNHTQWALLLNVSCLYFSCFLIFHGQKSVRAYCLRIVCCITMIGLQNVHLALLFFSSMWKFLNLKRVGIHYYIFFVCWFTCLPLS